MALVKNFKATTSQPNQTELTWDQPLGFNNSNDELIVTKTITHYPMELYNSNFPDKATDIRPIEIFRGSNITGFQETGVTNVSSLSFNGSDSRARITYNPTYFSQIDNISTALWFKSSSSFEGVVFSQYDFFPLTERKWRIALQPTGEVRVIVIGAGGTLKDYRSTASLSDNTWHHVAFTYSSGTLKVYIDGVELTGGAIDKATDDSMTDLQTSSADIMLGAQLGNDNPGGIFDGLLDEVTYWNKELSNAEVVELYNSGQVFDYSNHSAAVNLIEWFRADGDTLPTIVGHINGQDAAAEGSLSLSSDVPPSQSNTIVVTGNTITDDNATFPTNPGLEGRLLRDSSSQVHRILSNTTTTITLETEPAEGKYIILSDFPTEIRTQENYELDIRTTAGPGFIQDLVIIDNGQLVLKEFKEDELANLIFQDNNGDKFIIKSNTSNTVFFFESSETPEIGPSMSILNSFNNSTLKTYIDNFRTQAEADSREGTLLRDNVFYYYTIFTKKINANVAQAEFSLVDSNLSTQAHALSMKDRNFEDILYRFWPSLHREMDTTGDLEDLMKVFGFQFNKIHSLIETYNLQDPDNVLVSALLPLSEQTGLAPIGYSIGADTLRRVARNMIQCWKLKGSKEGIALFIRKITTWDITNGTADFGGSIIDFLPNIDALRFFDPNLGSLNTRITETDPFVAGGRFARSLPGIVIPGFFTFREFVVTVPNVALYVGTSSNFSISNGTTTMEDSSANFGATDSLVGNFLLPNQEEVNDIYEIIGNTTTTITVRGVIVNTLSGGDYAILSPLNTSRFNILNELLPSYIPFGTKAGFIFT